MSIAMGLVPSSVVATVTWHVVGLHGGKQDACPLAGSSSGLGESLCEALQRLREGAGTRAHKGHCWILVDGLRRWAPQRGKGEEQKERR